MDANSYEIINSTNLDFGYAYAVALSNDSSKIAYNVYAPSTSVPRIITLNSNNSITLSSTTTTLINDGWAMDFNSDDKKLIKCGTNGY